LERHRRRETVPPSAKNTAVAVQQRPSAERARRLFSADRCVDFGGPEVRRNSTGESNPVG
jgi:hypothetical protein